MAQTPLWHVTASLCEHSWGCQLASTERRSWTTMHALFIVGCAPLQVALQQDDCYAVRAAALRFLAVAMAVSSADAASEAHPDRQHSLAVRVSNSSPTAQSAVSADPRFQPDMTDSEEDEASLHATPGLRLRAPPARATGSRAALAGPLMLQSSFAAQYYTQEIWDFGIEQLLLQEFFWEKLLSLLQVWSPCQSALTGCQCQPE